MEHYHLCWLDDGGGDVVAEAGDASQHSKIINGEEVSFWDKFLQTRVELTHTNKLFWNIDNNDNDNHCDP